MSDFFALSYLKGQIMNNRWAQTYLAAFERVFERGKYYQVGYTLQNTLQTH